MTKKNNVHSYNSRTSTNAKNNVTATTQELPQMTKKQCNSYNSRTSTNDKNTMFTVTTQELTKTHAMFTITQTRKLS